MDLGNKRIFRIAEVVEGVKCLRETVAIRAYCGCAGEADVGSDIRGVYRRGAQDPSDPPEFFLVVAERPVEVEKFCFPR